MFWHLFMAFVLALYVNQKNEIFGKLCPSTGQLASQREVSPFIQLSVQMFNKPPYYTPYIQLSHSNTWRRLRENQFVGFPKHYFNKIFTTTNWPVKRWAMCAGGGNKHNKSVNGAAAGGAHTITHVLCLVSVILKTRQLWRFINLQERHIKQNLLSMF